MKRSLALENVKKGLNLQKFVSEFQNDKEIVLEAVKQRGYSLKYAAEELKKDKEIVLEAVKQRGGALEYAAEELKKDKEFVLEAVKQNGYALEYAAEELKKDKEFVLEAVKQKGYALKYAAEELKKDKEIVLEAVKQRGGALEYAAEELKKDKEFVLEAVKQRGGALEYAAEELKKDKEIVLEAVKQYGYALEYAAEELKKDKEFVLEAVKQNGYALEYAAEELKKDKEIVLEAVKQYGYALEYAAEELKKDKEIVLEAVKQDCNALKFAAEELKSNINFISTLIRKIVEEKVSQNRIKLKREMEIDIKELETLKLLSDYPHSNCIVTKRKWLGRGGGVIVAVKEFQTDDSESIKNEIIINQSLQHENVVKTYGFSMIGKSISLVMEFVDGPDLFNLLHKKKRKLNWEEKWKILKQMCVSVNYLHCGKCSQVLHRDIKSRKSDMCVKLIDFGFSKVKISQSSIRPNSIHPNISKIGTIRWKAPETINVSEKEKYTDKADIWSLGLTIYELITGKIPFEGIEDNFIIEKRLKEGKILKISENVPPILKKIYRKCCRIKPEKRLSSQELLNLINKSEPKFLLKYGSIEKKMEEIIEKASSLEDFMKVSKNMLIKEILQTLYKCNVDYNLKIEISILWGLIEHLRKLIEEGNLSLFLHLPVKTQYLYLKILSRFFDLYLFQILKGKNIINKEEVTNTLNMLKKLGEFTKNFKSLKTNIKYEISLIKECVKNFKTNQKDIMIILKSIGNFSEIASLGSTLYGCVKRIPKYWYAKACVLRISILENFKNVEEVQKLISEIKPVKDKCLNYCAVQILSEISKFHNDLNTKMNARMKLLEYKRIKVDFEFSIK